MISAPDRLGETTRGLLADPESDLYLSAAAVWEIGIKRAAGKLRYSGNPSVQIPIHIRRSGVVALNVTIDHALAAAALPPHHRDPFDRMMLAQAIEGRMTLVTADSRLAAYGAEILDATT